ncbi:MAG: thioesterase family protein [Neomegalonema sp.]
MSESGRATDVAPACFKTPFPNAPLDCGERAVDAAWIDYNGHMNIGYYGVAFDQAIDLVFDEGIDWGGPYAAREKMGPFALQSQLHFLDELKLGESFVVRFQLLDCDHKRIHYFATMYNLRTGSLAATCETVSMNVDLTARRSAPLPDRQRRRIEELLNAHRELPRPELAGASLGLRR